MDMELNKLVTIVIPCKNESKIIDTTLALLNMQTNIKGVNVIIADSSDDDTPKRLKDRNNDEFNLIITEGGLPSRARNNGAKLAKTPYILFLDSDIFLMDNNLLVDSIDHMMKGDNDLLTAKIRTTTKKYNYIFRIFDIIQLIMKYVSPFCVGGFMMIDSKKFNELGGFDEQAQVSEDYLLSKQISGKRFKIMNRIIYTTPRRFENKGVLYIIKLMISSYLNRNNKKYFSEHNTYWK